MRHPVDIGVIGDFNPEFDSHVATNSALRHAAGPLNVAVRVSWIPTPDLDRGSAPARLSQFHGILCSPGSPYRSMGGALAGITFARERGRPFFGT